MYWSFDEFKRIARACGYGYIKKSSLSDIMTMAEGRFSANLIGAKLAALPAEKRDKYQDLIKYFAFNYPMVVPRSNLTATPTPFVPNAPTFQQVFYQGPNADPYANGDLLYGRAGRDAAVGHKYVGRDADPYGPPNNSNLQRVRVLDNYNNAAGLGNGIAFATDWKGHDVKVPQGQMVSFLSVRSRAFQDYNTANFSYSNTGQFQQQQYQAYLDGLFASRFSPSHIVHMDEAKMKKHDLPKLENYRNTYSADEMRQRERRRAMLGKAIRRVCKGGIAMVASSPSFANARVHFVLDDLGDLNDVAQKCKLPNGSTPITTSELCFTCRYWGNLSNKVFFWLNGRRVYAPWDADWVGTGFNGTRVASGQESWLRYQAYRQMAGKTNKTMPVWAV